MKSEYVKKGMTVTVRPSIRGVARFDAVAESVQGNFVRVLRGKDREPWTVGLHEWQPYDGLTDFQRKIVILMTTLKSNSVGDIILRLDCFKNATTPREQGAQEASVVRAVRKHPLCNYVEAKRLDGNNKKERKMMLYLKGAQ